MPSHRVLLLSMPWASAEYPALSLGLLSGILEQAGLGCDVLYGNLVMLRQLGDASLYRALSYAAEGDAAFTPLYFGSSSDEAARLIAERTGTYAHPPLADLKLAHTVLDQAARTIDDLFKSIAWERYDIVGFSIMFQQLLASLCLARRIKQAFPEKWILFGGASCEGEMGLEMLHAFAEIDCVAIGEADATIASLIREIRSRPERRTAGFSTPGIAWRNDAGQVCRSAPAPITEDLDGLPVPRFESYFQQIAEQGLADLDPVLYVETSRGCWWGQKHHCSFCGLNGKGLRFRSKSPSRAVAEFTELSRRHRIHRFWTSDNILDHRAFAELVPALQRLRSEGYDLGFFYEIKSTLRKDQLLALRRAGIRWVQPGIESLSDHVLQLMGKGASALQQVAMLKHLAELGMRADWNLIYRIPGERPEDYQQMTSIIREIHHLPPPMPGAVIPMNLHRFSRYHQAPEQFGIRNVRPVAYYRGVFPDTRVEASRLAYVFEHDDPNDGNAALLAAREQFFRAVATWRQVHHSGSLVFERGPGYVEICDARAAVPVYHTLTGWLADLYCFCDVPRSLSAISTHLAPRAKPAEIGAALADLARKHLLLNIADRHLALALRTSAGRDALCDDVASIAVHAGPLQAERRLPTITEVAS